MESLSLSVGLESKGELSYVIVVYKEISEVCVSKDIPGLGVTKIK